MKKFLTVLLWMGLAASLTMLFSVISQKNALLQAEYSAVQKNETIQAQYDEAKAQLDQALSAEKKLTDEKEALTQEKAALEAQLKEANAALQAVRLEAESLAQSERAAQEALETARQAWEEQRQALTAKRDDADDQLAETMAAPLPGVQAADAPQSPETDQQPACPETEEATPPSSGKLPAKRDEVYSIFQSLHFQDKTITRQADSQ